MIYANCSLQMPYVSNTFDPGELGQVKVINGDLMVYNGSWQKISVYTNIHIDKEIDNILTWAKNKIKQEAEEEELAAKFPAFAKARENFKLMKAMVRNELA